MQNRLTHQIDQFLKDILACALGGIEHGDQGGIRARPPLGSETAQHLAMNDRRSQDAIASVVVGRYIWSVEEHEQVFTMRPVAVKQIHHQSPDHPSGAATRRGLLQYVQLFLQALDFLRLVQYQLDQVFARQIAQVLWDGGDHHFSTQPVSQWPVNKIPPSNPAGYCHCSAFSAPNGTCSGESGEQLPRI
jgi:hypothetical protein